MFFQDNTLKRADNEQPDLSRIGVFFQDNTLKRAGGFYGILGVSGGMVFMDFLLASVTNMDGVKGRSARRV